MAPAALVPPPPGQAARDERANEAWGRAMGAAHRRSRLRSIQGDSDDANDTRRVVSAVMFASGAGGSESDEEMAEQLEREMQEDEGGDGTGPSQLADGMSLDEIERELMRDSDVEDSLDESIRQVESDENGGGPAAGSNQGGTSSGGEAGPSKEYESQRDESVQRNQAHLRKLGLLVNPMVPAARPSSAPRQRRLPRAPQEPTRVSDRQRGKAKPTYSEEQTDKELEEQLASDGEGGESLDGQSESALEDDESPTRLAHGNV